MTIRPRRPEPPPRRSADGIDDALDELVELVLLRGGWVALVEDGALADRDRVALAVPGRT